MRAAARGPFASQAPRPYNRPSSICTGKDPSTVSMWSRIRIVGGPLIMYSIEFPTASDCISQPLQYLDTDYPMLVRAIPQALSHGVFDRRRRRGTRERIPAERGIVAPLELTLHVLCGEGRSDRDAAREGLRQREQVRLHAPPLHSEQAPRPAHPGLYFVEDEEGPGSVACLTGGRQVFRGRHMHAAFTLDRLEDDRRGIMIDGFPQSLDVVERDMLESGDERLERLTEILPPGRAECPHRPSMETAHRRDDLLPSCRGARKLDRGLDGLGARVAQEDSTEVSRCNREELLDEGRLRGRPEHGPDVDQLPRLGLDCLDDGRIAMS